MDCIERHIREELERIREQLRSGDDREVLVWAIEGELACSQRPWRDHPQFGGRQRVPPGAKHLVIAWVERMLDLGIRSVICLLDTQQLPHYYGACQLHEEGLLGYYRARGLRVRRFSMTDYQRPNQNRMQEVLGAFRELPKPVLLHCSASIDRTAPVAAFIVSQTCCGPPFPR